MAQQTGVQRKETSDALIKVLAQIGELETLVGDFQGDNDQLHAKLNEYVGGLSALHAAAASLRRLPGGALPVEVPAELLSYLDDGGNPDVFLVDVMRSCQAAAQAGKGKVEGFRAWRDALASQLEQADPQLSQDYKALRRPAAAGAEQPPPAAT